MEMVMIYSVESDDSNDEAEVKEKVMMMITCLLHLPTYLTYSLNEGDNYCLLSSYADGELHSIPQWKMASRQMTIVVVYHTFLAS